MRDKRLFSVLFGGRAVTPAFVPSDIANLSLWLKADAGAYQDAGATTPATADTNPVRLWQDQSGNNNHATAASDTVRPLLKLNIQNSLPSIRYDGIDDLLNTVSFLGAGYNKALSYFVVITTATAVSGTKVYMGNSGANWYTGRDTQPYFTYHQGLDSVNSRKLRISPTTEWKKGIEGMTYDGTTRRTYQKGNYIEEAENGDLNLSGALTVGGYSTGAFLNNWDIHELLVFNRGLSVTEATQINQYLATKWGMPLCTRRLYFECDSLTAGVGATAGNDYPRQLWALLGSNPSDHIWNYAVTSSTINIAVGRASTTSFGYNDPVDDIESIVLFLAGTNDINGGESGADTYAEYVSYCQARQAQGYKVIAFTMLPFGTVAAHETERQAFNVLVRANWATFSDAIADIAADSRIGDSGDQNDTTYFADKIHCTDAGYAIVAGIAKTAIDTIA